MATLANKVSVTPTKRKGSRTRRRENLYGYLFLTPWLLGFFGLFVGPGLASLYLSLTKYDVLSPPQFIGAANYVKMFTDDDLFWPSLWRTFYFAGLGVPLGILGSMFLAILLNMKLKGVGFYRTLFFMPSLVPLVASVVLVEMAAQYRLWLGQPSLTRLGHGQPTWLVFRPALGHSFVDLVATVGGHRWHADDHLLGRVTGHSRFSL